MGNELKPDLSNCPFCNGEARMMRESDGDCVGNFHFVECRLCRARSRGHFASYGNDCPVFYAGVREDWNRRALSPSASDPVGEPVAEVVSWTNGSYSRNYKLRWLRDVPEGAKLYASPLPQEPREAEQVCAEAYQVVGSLLSDLGRFDMPEAQRILDNLSQAKLVHKDVLPWPSYAQEPREAALTKELLETLRSAEVGLANAKSYDALPPLEQASVVKALDRVRAAIARSDREIRGAQEGKAGEAFKEALQQIADMDPAGLRADDLGRAARVARNALAGAQTDGDQHGS